MDHLFISLLVYLLYYVSLHLLVWVLAKDIEAPFMHIYHMLVKILGDFQDFYMFKDSLGTKSVYKMDKRCFRSYQYYNGKCKSKLF